MEINLFLLQNMPENLQGAFTNWQVKTGAFLFHDPSPDEWGNKIALRMMVWKGYLQATPG